LEFDLINIRTLGLLLVMGILALIGLWVSDKLTPVTSTGVTTESNRPDYSMENFTVTAMGVSGKPRYHLSAASMLHYPGNDETHMKNPNLVLYEANKSPLIVQSDTGVYSGVAREVLLSGAVRIERSASQNNQPYSMETEWLKILPDDKKLETDRLIVLKSGRSFVQATGMIADLGKETIELISNVRGTYVPQAK
jgi:lipopolysaccharide export system protein LptC